jgi:hypothetical protein
VAGGTDRGIAPVPPSDPRVDERAGFAPGAKLATLHGLVKCLLSISCALLAAGCGQSLAPPTPVAPLDPVAMTAEPADSVPVPDAEVGWVVSSFGFLYAGEDEAVDAMDIDGITDDVETPAEAGTCAHADFSSPGGGEGIDHQLLRLIMTYESLHAGGIADQIIDNSAKDGSMTILLTADDEALGIMVGADAPFTDNDGQVLPHSSFRPHADAAYHADLGPAEIVDGVWLAGPADVRLRLNVQIVAADLLLRDAYLRVTFDDDGRAQGVLQGYWSREGIVEILASTTAHLAALGYTLEEFEAVLDQHADAGPDGDGVCQELSSAFRFTAEPAFLLPAEGTP